MSFANTKFITNNLKLLDWDQQNLAKLGILCILGQLGANIVPSSLRYSILSSCRNGISLKTELEIKRVSRTTFMCSYRICNKKLGFIKINTSYDNFKFKSVISSVGGYLSPMY